MLFTIGKFKLFHHPCSNQHCHVINLAAVTILAEQTQILQWSLWGEKKRGERVATEQKK